MNDDRTSRTLIPDFEWVGLSRQALAPVLEVNQLASLCIFQTKRDTHYSFREPGASAPWLSERAL